MTIEIIAFTDPVCTWCWGAEPVLRAVQSRCGDQVHLSYVMGGLVKDIRAFHDAGNAIGGDPQRAIADFVTTLGSASDVEITTAFDLTDAEWTAQQPQALALGLTAVQAGNGRFLRPAIGAAGTCDPVTGMCVA